MLNSVILPMVAWSKQELYMDQEQDTAAIKVLYLSETKKGFVHVMENGLGKLQSANVRY